MTEIRRKDAAPDQARQLREMSPQEPLPVLAGLAITGGKGGVGKTCVAVNLSLALAEQGMRPLLVDLDLGLANADVLLGISPATTLYDVMMQGKSAASAVMQSNNIGFLPAASGRDELTQL